MESCLISKIVVFLAWSLQILKNSFVGKGVEMGKIFSSRDRTVTESAKIKCQNGRDETPTKSPTGNLRPVLGDLQVELAGSLFLNCHREGGRLLGCLLSRNGYQPLPLLFVSNHSTVHNKEGFSNPGLHEALKWKSFTSHTHVWNSLRHILFLGYSLQKF